MKTIIAVILFSLAVMVKAAPAVNVDRLIETICQIEDGHWGKPGGRGNMLYRAWSDSSDLPYYASANESLAMPVYRRHIAKIAAELRLYRVPVNAQTIGTCWRWGVEGARRRKWSSDQGQRTQNLYDDKSW